MMLHRTRTVLLVAGLALPLAAPVRAAAPATPAPAMHHSGMHQHGQGHEHAGEWEQWFRDLQLTPEQKQSLKDIAEHYRPRWFELRQRGEAIRDQLLQAAPQEADYATRTLAASQAAGALAADGVTLLSQMRAEMDGVLTASQRQALKDKWHKRQQQWDRWKQQHGGTNPPDQTRPVK